MTCGIRRSIKQSKKSRVLHIKVKLCFTVVLMFTGIFTSGLNVGVSLKTFVQERGPPGQMLEIVQSLVVLELCNRCASARDLANVKVMPTERFLVSLILAQLGATGEPGVAAAFLAL